MITTEMETTDQPMTTTEVEVTATEMTTAEQELTTPAPAPDASDYADTHASAYTNTGSSSRSASSRPHALLKQALLRCAGG